MAFRRDPIFSLTLPAKIRFENEPLIVEGIDYLRIDL